MKYEAGFNIVDEIPNCERAGNFVSRRFVLGREDAHKWQK